MEKEKALQRKWKIVLKTIFTMVVLFGLPAASWYFLSSGVKYRKERLAELSDLGKVGSFKVKNQSNLPVSPEIMKGRVSVVHFLPEDQVEAKNQTAQIARLHRSFDDTEDLIFLSFLPADSTTNLLGKAKELDIKDEKQWFLLGAKKEELNVLATNNFKIQDPATGVALVDTSLTVRRIYNIGSSEDLNLLVEHIAMVIPKQKRRTL